MAKKILKKRKSNAGRKKLPITLTVDGETRTFERQEQGEDVKLVFNTKEKPDYEETMEVPKDGLEGIKYPPPKKHPVFRKKWSEFIESIVTRENFKVGHLNNLEVLCDLYVEYEELQKFIRKKGRSYLSVGRSGEVWKFYPEVGQLSRVQSLIKDYTRLLNLSPKKDHTVESGGEKDSWNEQL